MKYFFLLLLVVNAVIFAVGQSSSLVSNDTVLDESWSYCFEFTWFGPGYDNVTRYDGTCTDYIDNTRAGDNIPCSPPVVLTYNSAPPDIDYLFEHHKTSVLCKRSANQVCAKYSFIYNGVVNNATYMCTKVQKVGGEAITSGCYTQNYEGYTIEMCVCKSNPGVFRPCNNALSTQLHGWAIFLTLFALIIY